ncbi:MAG: hypothetical protein ABNH38_00245 [Tateyamaria sp.]|uniref:hypothetical protein n=1 Tax=Tateyamaria sp. TaxID=1929288 RepID=UPI0032DC2840
MTSHTTGAARGSDRAVDHMVLCVGAQSVVVYIGADGAPVSVPHHCPDCALHALDVLEPGGPLVGSAPVYAHHAVPAQEPARIVSASFHGMARAPPILI